MDRSALSASLPLVLLLLGAAVSGAVATVGEETAGIDSAALVTTADADADGHVAAGTLEVTLDTTCDGCYDGGGVLDDSGMDPRLEVQVDGSRVVLTELDRQETQAVRWTLGELVDVVERETATVSITLYDDDLTGREAVDSRQLTVDVEPPAADENPETTTATPEQSHPTAGNVRSTAHFNFRYDGVERCGTTCAAAAGTVWPARRTSDPPAAARCESDCSSAHRRLGLVNRLHQRPGLVSQPGRTLSNVTVDVRLVSGTTVVWRASTTVGDLSIGERRETTLRADPSVADLRAVKANDGRVTLVVELRSDRYHEVLTYDRVVDLPV